MGGSTTRHRSRLIALVAGLALLVGVRSHAGTISATHIQETFINQNDIHTNTSTPNFSNGSCGYVVIGAPSHTLVQFSVPNMGGREIVDSVTFGMTLRVLPGVAGSVSPLNSCPSSTNGLGANYALDPINQAWVQGSGCGVQGQGTWQTGSSCAGASWSTPGTPSCATLWTDGGNTSTLSTTARFTTGTSAGFQSSTSNCTNVGSSWCSMVQGWADGGSNFGFSVRNDGSAGTGTCHVQYFTKNTAALSFNYSCKSGFEDESSTCKSCGPTNRANCHSTCTSADVTTTGGAAPCTFVGQALTGNGCNDLGGNTPPAYNCTCTNAAYTAGPSNLSCIDKNECTITGSDPCKANGDSGASCTDAPAPKSGHHCVCSTLSGFKVVNDNTSSATCVSGCTTGAGGTQKTASDPCVGTPPNVGNNFCTPSGAGTWTCTCVSGWVSQGSGQPVCADFQACTSGSGNTSCQVSNPQSTNGNTCTDATAPSTSWTCGCNSPAYDGNGTTACTNHNPCASTPNPCTANGDSTATCTDVAAPGVGQTCGCTTGFNRINIGTVNETCVSGCSAGTSKTANDPCVGTPPNVGNNFCTAGGVAGTWSCTCASGWISSGGSTPICNDFNACTMGSGNASCKVSNPVGTNGNTCTDATAPSTSWTCGCNSPAYDPAAGPACVDHNDCSPTDPCKSGGDTGASEKCTDAVAPASGHTCTCDVGFVSTGGTCQSQCHTGANPCNTGGDSGSSCTVVPSGGWTCACTAGYQSSGGATPSCQNINACTPAALLACATANGNTCVDENPPSVTYHCDCSNLAYVPNTGNATANSSCIDRNECQPNHCKDGGDQFAQCTDHAAPLTGYDCKCSSATLWSLAPVAGFQSCVDTDECVEEGGNPCLNGTCTNVTLGGGYKCDCDPGYVELQGDTPSPSCAHPNSCDDNAKTACVETQKDNHCLDDAPPLIGYTCACNNPAYTESTDHRSCVDKNACVPDHCGDGGDRFASCIDARAPSAGYQCDCGAGWSFDGTTCVDINECQGGANPCGKGTCSNLPGSYQCTCPQGYTLSKTAPLTCVVGENTNWTYKVIPGSCSISTGGTGGTGPSALFFLAGLLLVTRFARARRRARRA